MEISTSLLNVKRDEFSSKVYQIEAAHTDYFHIDVMDGKFVENSTINLMKEYADQLSGISSVPKEIHLMVENVKEYVEMFSPNQPSLIIFHLEAIDKIEIKNDKIEIGNEKNESRSAKSEINFLSSENKISENKIKTENNFDRTEKTMQLIQYIKDEDCKVGIAINPETDVREVYEFLPYIHNVLVMTVHPGKGGQAFIPECLDKIKALKKYIVDNNLDTIIEVDGGINFETAEQCSKAGADVAVVGSFIANSNNITDTIRKLKSI